MQATDVGARDAPGRKSLTFANGLLCTQANFLY